MENHISNFTNGAFYHVGNFGIDNRLVFNDEKDVARFIALLDYYRMKNPPARFAFRKRPIAREYSQELIPMVEVLAYCLMPNHFHLLVKQVSDGGVSNFMSKILNSYTKFYNFRQKRSGTIFKGPFRAHEISGSQVVDVSRYIHLEPLQTGLVLSLLRFPYSSMPEYAGTKSGFCSKQDILSHFENANEYLQFVVDREEYQETLPRIKNLVLE